VNPRRSLVIRRPTSVPRQLRLAPPTVPGCSPTWLGQSLPRPPGPRKSDTVIGGRRRTVVACLVVFASVLGRDAPRSLTHGIQALSGLPTSHRSVGILSNSRSPIWPPFKPQQSSCPSWGIGPRSEKSTLAVPSSRATLPHRAPFRDAAGSPPSLCSSNARPTPGRAEPVRRESPRPCIAPVWQCFNRRGPRCLLRGRGRRLGSRFSANVSQNAPPPRRPGLPALNGVWAAAC